MNRIKTGIIGAGNIAQKHITAFNNNKDLITISGVYDIDKDKSKLFSKSRSINNYSNLDSLIHDSELLIVGVPHNSYGEIIKKIVSNNNKYCLCEKPMGLDHKQYKQINKQQKSFIIPIFQNRFNSSLQFLKKNISQGNLGKIISIRGLTRWHRDDDYYTKSDWKGSKEKEGGILFNQGIHSLDVILWLLNITSKQCDIKYVVRNKFRQLKIETEDYIYLNFNSIGIDIKYEINTYGDRNTHENSLFFIGEKGIVSIGGKALDKILYYSCGEDELLDEEISDIYGNGHNKIIRKAINYMTTGERGYTLPTFDEGLDRIRLIQRIYKF